MKFTTKNRIWIEGVQGTFLGVGRIQLLESIDHAGSISGGAKQMGMSYKKAWGLVDAMNKEAEVELVIKKTGGAGGGSTLVTEEGKKAIAYFKALDKKCREFIDNEVKKHPLILK